MTSRPPARRPARGVACLSLIGLVLALVGLPGAVLAHAELKTVTPADGSTVVGAPAEVVMTFTQHLDPARSNIKLVNAAGTLVAQDSTVDVDKLTMRLAVPSDLPAGTYTARWTSFSTDDGEQDRGTPTFTVTAPTPPPSATPSAPPSAPPSGPPSASASSSSVAPSVAAPSPSTAPTTPTASTTDALIPIAVVVLAVLGLGLWFAARSRRAT